MRIPGAISTRLRVGLRKTGYLGLCTGSGHFIRDIFRPGRTRFHLQICRTSAGQCPATDFLRYAKDVIYLRIPDYNFRWKRSTTPQDHNYEGVSKKKVVSVHFGGFYWTHLLEIACYSRRP